MKLDTSGYMEKKDLQFYLGMKFSSMNACMHTVQTYTYVLLYRFGKDCGFKEDNETAVAIKYAKEQG